jgi:hypothetical protein
MSIFVNSKTCIEAAILGIENGHEPYCSSRGNAGMLGVSILPEAALLSAVRIFLPNKEVGQRLLFRPRNTCHLLGCPSTNGRFGRGQGRNAARRENLKRGVLRLGSQRTRTSTQVEGRRLWIRHDPGPRPID